MKYEIENVIVGREKKHLETRLQSISGRVNLKYNYAKKNLVVSYEEPYLIDEESLIHKSKTKKAIEREIKEFRYYQFNNVD